MEVEEIRRLALSEKKAHDVITPISEEISAERNRAIDRDIFGEQAFKPLVRMQGKVQRELRDEDKKGIDERQDALIGKLEENQKMIADRVDNVLAVDVNEFLRRFTPLELEKLQTKIGINVPELNTLTSDQLKEVLMGVKTVLTNTKRKAYKNRDHVYVSALEKLIDAINAMVALREHIVYKTTQTKGSGTRNYKQPKRHMRTK